MNRNADSNPRPPGNACVSLGTKSSASHGVAGESVSLGGRVPHAGVLIVNADDWGRDQATTERTLECVLRGTVSSVSAMVFMEDSERAATIAQERKIDTGLHINFTESLVAPNCPARLAEHHRRIAAYLRRHKFARVLFHPGLMRSFEYVLAAQLEEFQRLYGVPPARLDGHHHMHQCANILFAGLLPPGTIVRRNFSFEPGEKNFLNRYYRKLVDWILARRHHLVDYLFNLAPLEPVSRLQRVFSLARQHVVELEAHPANPDEYAFLTQGQILRRLGDFPVARRFALGRPSCLAIGA
jgi:predicted glycoside hydrolase/deacetylase ChbG (UPF0249 family)